jgi:hypothetical protein
MVWRIEASMSAKMEMMAVSPPRILGRYHTPCESQHAQPAVGSTMRPRAITRMDHSIQETFLMEH